MTNLQQNHDLHFSLRVCLQFDEESVAEYGECGDEYHEEGRCTRFHSVALLASGDARVLDHCESYQENWTVHLPLNLWVGERIELEE